MVNFTGFELPVAQTTAVRDNKIKNDEDRQALFIISTTSNRNFEFWVYDYTLGENTDTVNANFSGDVKTIYKGDTGRPADAPWFLVGTKKLICEQLDTTLQQLFSMVLGIYQNVIFN